MSTFLDTFNRNLGLSEARERVARVKEELLAERRKLDQALAAARQADDDDGRLSAQGLADKRRELERQAREAFGPEIERIAGQVRRDVQALQDAAEEARPQLSEKPGDLMRAQTAWEGVKDRLQAGMTPSQILANADVQTALAMREWGPAWLEAQAFRINSEHGGRPMGWQPPDPSLLSRAVDARLAELDDGYGHAHSAFAEAAGVAAYVEPLERHAKLGADPAAYGRAAMEAHYAEQGVQIDYATTAADPVDAGESTEVGP